MNKEHTNTCYDCIHLAVCYKIEHYGRDLETTLPCKEYIGISDRIEVVRCKDCKHLTFSDFYGECDRGYLSIVRPDCYCCYGEKRNSETT